MATATVITMLITLGIVWGGCIFVVTLALMRERRKTRHEV